MLKLIISPKKNSGFTIVELLVVIIVIAILATLTVVAYNGVQNRAAKSSLASALSNTAKRLEADKATRGSYSNSLANLSNSTATTDPGVDYQYTSSGDSFCLSAIIKSQAMHISSDNMSPADDVCSGHEPPATGPVTDPVVYTQVANTDMMSTPGGQTRTETINFSLQPNDYVFILFNSAYDNVVSLTVDGSPVSSVYSRTMGPSGYQRHFAFGFGGKSGTVSFTMRACWYVDCNYDSNIELESAYIAYVVRGLGPTPNVSSTYLGYDSSWKVGGQVMAHPGTSIPRGKLAIFSYLYFGNYLPSHGDNSSPNLGWITDSTVANTTNSPHSIFARHAYTNGVTNVSYQATMDPANNYHSYGSVLFTIQ